MSPYSLSDSLSDVPKDLKLIEVKANGIINHYRILKDNGKITPDQFAKIYDGVYGVLQNTTDWRI
jgi:hypothetical protein